MSAPPDPAKPAVDLSQYRPNVGLALFDRRGLVFIGKRAATHGLYAWQMPQGGVDPGEPPEVAALRELEEETGVGADLVQPLGAPIGWLTYDFPPEVLARGGRDGKRWRGQKQKWFAFRFLGEAGDIRLDAHTPAEFDAWDWEELANTPDLVIPWKRPVYEAVAKAFAPMATPVDQP